MLAQEAAFAEKGVFGTDLLGYRYVDGRSQNSPQSISAKQKHPSSWPEVWAREERMELVKEMNPWCFTMGSALFTKNFVKEGTFRDNLVYVVGFLKYLGIEDAVA